MNQQMQTPNKIYEVTSNFKKAGAVVLDRFGTQSEAMAFARSATDTIEPEESDSLVSVTVTNQVTKKILSTFYPDFYEAESQDDDDDG
jgi:hypothetical protein